MLLAFNWTEASSTLSFSPTSSLPALDKAYVTLRDAPVGNTDGVSLPYFAEADAVILYWVARVAGFQGPEYAQLTLTARVTETSMSGQNHTVFSVLAADPNTRIPFNTPPLITVYLTSDNHLASVEFPSKPGSCLAPSYTSKFRVVLMYIIAPLTLVGSTVISVIIEILKGIVGLSAAFALGWVVRRVLYPHRTVALSPTSETQDVEQSGADKLILSVQEGTPGDVTETIAKKVDV